MSFFTPSLFLLVRIFLCSVILLLSGLIVYSSNLVLLEVYKSNVRSYILLIHIVISRCSVLGDLLVRCSLIGFNVLSSSFGKSFFQSTLILGHILIISFTGGEVIFVGVLSVLILFLRRILYLFFLDLNLTLHLISYVKNTFYHFSLICLFMTLEKEL